MSKTLLSAIERNMDVYERADDIEMYFIFRGRYVEALDSLRWLRERDFDLRGELQILTASYKDTMETEKEEEKGFVGQKKRMEMFATLLTISFLFCRSIVSQARSVFKRPDIYRPLLLFLVISFLQQMSGMASISYYAVNVMVESGSAVNEVF